MARQDKCCCKQVKEVIKKSSLHHHRSCNSTKNTQVIRGKILNGYFKCHRFRRDTDYSVCQNMSDKIGDYEPPPERNKNKKRKVSGRDHNTRNSPLEIIVPKIRLDLEKLKHVQVKVTDMLELPVIKLTEEKSVFRSQTVRESYLKCIQNKYRKSYNDCSYRVRREKAKAIGDDVIAMCLDQEKDNLLNNFETYLRTDDNLLVDINMLLDDCRDYIGLQLKRKMSEVPGNIPASAPVEHSDLKIFEPTEKLKLGVALLGSSTKNNYNMIMKKITELVGLDKREMPSYHMLTKNRPPVIGEVFKPSKDLFSEPTAVANFREEKYFEERLLELEKKYDPNDTEEVIELEQEEILSGKIEGGYSKYIDLILKKYYDANID